MEKLIISEIFIHICSITFTPNLSYAKVVLLIEGLSQHLSSALNFVSNQGNGAVGLVRTAPIL